MIIHTEGRQLALAQMGVRRALTADAVMSGAAGVLLTAFAWSLDDVLGPGPGLLTGFGGFFLVWSGYLLLTARRAPVPRMSVLGIVVGNLAWVALTVVVLVSGWLPLTGLGLGVAIGQGLAVLAIAEWQYLALRRA